MSGSNTILDVRGLKTHFSTDQGTVKSVDGVDLTVQAGKTLCVVGESGCGKSVTARSILQIMQPGKIVDGEILYHRRRSDNGSTGQTETIDIAKADPRGPVMGSIRGNEIAMIFQEPMTSFSPVHTIGDQIVEAILLHLPMTKDEARTHAIDMLRKVYIPKPEMRVDAYPFQLSGGMRQRAMIAMALSCDPSLLIADEPTTALDVTTQAQILDLLLELKERMGMAMMFITHDLGVVAEVADDVTVMYLGTAAEQAPVDDIFHAPKHPYTQALLRSIPKLGFTTRQRLDSIQGMVPDPYERPQGCPFHPRCTEFMAGTCDAAMPPVTDIHGEHQVRCFLHGGTESIVGTEHEGGQRS